MVFGRMVWNYIPDATLWRVPAWRFGYYFVILDIMSAYPLSCIRQILMVVFLTSAFIVQVYGAASAESNSNTIAQTLQGIHVYMGGVAIQQFFIFCFCAFAYKFWRRLLAQKTTVVDENPASADLSLKSGFTLLYAMIAVLMLISVNFLHPSCPEHLLVSNNPHSCESSSVSPNTQKVCNPRSLTMRPFSIVLTRCRCCWH